MVKRRWAVERTLSRLMLHRRLARDYESLPRSSESMIYIAMIDNASKRVTGENAPTWRGACQDDTCKQNTLSGWTESVDDEKSL